MKGRFMAGLPIIIRWSISNVEFLVDSASVGSFS